MKVQGLGLFHSLPQKNKIKINSKCRVMRAKVVLEDMGIRENGVKMHATQEFFFTRPRIKL
jgi:hypothetical protein